MSYIETLFNKTCYAPAKDIARALQDYNVLGLVAHASPDADALGSMLALAHGLKSMGKTVYLCNASPIPEYLAWLPYTGTLASSFGEDVPQPEVVLVLDCGDAARLGDIEEYILSYPTINIDHHLNNPLFGSVYNWAAPSMAATGQMVAAVLYYLDVALVGHVAECIYTAVSSDTGNLTYDNTTEDVFLLCAHLMQQGLKLNTLREELDKTWHVARMHLWGELMKSVTLERDGTVVLAEISLQDLERTHTRSEDLEGFVEHLRRLRGVRIAGTVREDSPKSCKVSLRSSGTIDVRAIVAQLGGGGHRNAAGATLHYPLHESKDLVLQEIYRWLDDNNR